MSNTLVKFFLVTIIVSALAGCTDYNKKDTSQNDAPQNYVNINEEKFVVEYIQHAKKRIHRF